VADESVAFAGDVIDKLRGRCVIAQYGSQVMDDGVDDFRCVAWWLRTPQKCGDLFSRDEPFRVFDEENQHLHFPSRYVDTLTAVSQLEPRRIQLEFGE
jgi:hypothetical protein